MLLTLFPVLVLVVVFYYQITSIARITEMDDTRVGIRNLLGNERVIPLDRIIQLHLIRLGFLTHATLRIRTDRFWSLQRGFYVIPVRGRFMDQQGFIRSLWGRVLSTEARI